LSFHTLDEEFLPDEPGQSNAETDSSDDSTDDDDDGDEDVTEPAPPQPDPIPGFDSSASPEKRPRNALRNPLRQTFPATNFTREEIIAVFSSLKVRHKVADALLLEIFGILNRMLDSFSNQRPLPTTRYAVTRLEAHDMPTNYNNTYIKCVIVVTSLMRVNVFC
jgi:hypothetical protein